MIFRKAIVIFITVLICSVFWGNYLNIISVGQGMTDEDVELSNTGWPRPGPQPKTETSWNPHKSVVDLDLIFNDSSDHLIWFLQISDLHISIFEDPLRVSELMEFCDLTISAIKPTVVLASGDLTDAKTSSNMGSQQYIDEWKMYKHILDESNVKDKTVWLDVRGNHDNFNVLNRRSKENYFQNYSIQGAAHPKSYLYQTRHGKETYSFIAVDSCLEPGPRRPFNFIGILTQSEAEHVSLLGKESLKNGGDYTIWFGHYPTSAILSPSRLRSIIGEHQRSLAYLCGHFHTLGGLVPSMYTRHHDGFLELELGDWKVSRLFRLAAIDHGLLSFVDVPHRSWPLVLVTNPKHALYIIPGREPLRRMRTSTHIRILAFSLSDIGNVKVRIDDGEFRDCIHAKGPLYVLPWDPLKYVSGMHNIYVVTNDSLGRQTTIVQPFSLDGTSSYFPLMPRIVLMTSIITLFQVLFGVMVFICVVPLCVLRYLHSLVKAGRFQKPRLSIRPVQWWVQKLWVLSSVDRIFYPLVLYALYLTVGPWCVGDIVENTTGFIFAWGTIIDGHFQPAGLTYVYGFLQMCWFQLPLTFVLAHSLDLRLDVLYNKRRLGRIRRLSLNLLFLAIVLMQLILALYFYFAYGTMAFLLGPLRTWSVVLAIVLWHMSVNIPDECLRDVATIWCANDSRLSIRQ